MIFWCCNFEKRRTSLVRDGGVEECQDFSSEAGSVFRLPGSCSRFRLSEFLSAGRRLGSQTPKNNRAPWMALASGPRGWHSYRRGHERAPQTLASFLRRQHSGREGTFPGLRSHRFARKGHQDIFFVLPHIFGSIEAYHISFVCGL